MGTRLDIELLTAGHRFIIDYNPHRVNNESVEEYISSLGEGNEKDDIDNFIYCSMIESDTIWLIQYYPENSISFYFFWGSTIEEALRSAKETI